MTDIIESVPKPKQSDDVQQLVERARAEGVDLVGPGGLLTGLTKTVLETALEAEMSGHLGYDKHDPAGRTGGNSRNGSRAKTVLTEIGPVPIEVPRDRDGSFEPVIVRKRQRRLDGIDQLVLLRAIKTAGTAGYNSAVQQPTVPKGIRSDPMRLRRDPWSARRSDDQAGLRRRGGGVRRLRRHPYRFVG